MPIVEVQRHPARKRIDWQIRDPKGKSVEFFREVRNEIKGKVMGLIAD